MTKSGKKIAKPRAATTFYTAPALEKGFDIIELLVSAPDGLTSSEIAQRLNRSVSEIFRMLVVMERRNWLNKDADDRYSISYHVVETALRASPTRTLGAAAVPIMYELASATVQSCHIAVLSDAGALIVLQQDSPAHSSFSVRLGTRIHPTHSCSGRVLLAFSDADTVEKVLVAVKISSAEMKEVRARLPLIRERGYEIRASVRSMGVTDISYPIFGFDGRVRATLTMPFLTVIDGTQQIDIEHARQHVEKAARKISGDLGWFNDK